MRCPVCKQKNTPHKDPETGKRHVRKYGKFRRKSDSKVIQRYVCLICEKTFSSACNNPAYKQNKRRLNFKIKIQLSSLCSMRRIAKNLNTSRITVARKLIFLGELCLKSHKKALEKKLNPVEAIQFDELQTIEHTKCKPLSIAVAVAEKSRKIIGFSVSSMPATGHLAKVAYKKYGFRPDKRREGLERLFEQIKPLVTSKTTFHSDQHPYYKGLIERYFPKSSYRQSKGSKGCVSGQGELKKQGKDPLFYINHTLAMLRANINRLIRKTWCTTKDPTQLAYHLAIYMMVHNTLLT